MFEQHKKISLKKLEDARKAGEVDQGIDTLLDIINSKEGICTTSSCIGRFHLAIFRFDTKQKYERIWLKHDTTSAGEVESHVPKKFNGYLLLMIEPPILHLCCKDLNTAEKVLKLAREGGLKRSGIFSITKEKIVLELMSTESIKCVIGKDSKFNTEALGLAVETGNHLIRRAKEKIKKLQIKFSSF